MYGFSGHCLWWLHMNGSKISCVLVLVFVSLFFLNEVFVCVSPKQSTVLSAAQWFSRSMQGTLSTDSTVGCCGTHKVLARARGYLGSPAQVAATAMLPGPSSVTRPHQRICGTCHSSYHSHTSAGLPSSFQSAVRLKHAILELKGKCRNQAHPT